MTRELFYPSRLPTPISHVPIVPIGPRTLCVNGSHGPSFSIALPISSEPRLDALCESVCDLPVLVETSCRRVAPPASCRPISALALFYSNKLTFTLIDAQSRS